MNNTAQNIVNSVPHNNSSKTGVCKQFPTGIAAKGDIKQQVNTTAHLGQEKAGKKILHSVVHIPQVHMFVVNTPQIVLPTPEFQIDECDIEDNLTLLAQSFLDSQALTVNGVDIDSEDLTEECTHEDIEKLLFRNNSETILSVIEGILSELIPKKLERAKIEGANPLNY